MEINMKKILILFVAMILALSCVSCSKSRENAKYAKNGLEYVVNEDNESCTVVGMGKCTDTVVEVPEKIGKYSVTVIGEEAFCAGRYDSCAEIVEVILPEGLVSIKTGAFARDEKLLSINIPSTVTEIGSHAFEYCKSLKEISLPIGISEIGAQTFMSCTSLESILIPDGVKKIGASAFNGCEKLDGIVIPESVTEIGDRAFSASGIRYARVGAKIKKIGKNAFSLCDNFENFYYAGTLSQWREVECDGTWSDENGVFYCADIEFPISDLYE